MSSSIGNRRTIMRYALLAGAVVLASQGCSEGSDSPIGPLGALPRPGVTVMNDQSALDARVKHQRTTVPLSRNGVSSQSVQALGDPSHTSFIHVASVTPPEIEGHILPATHIITRGNLAYVSYASISQSRFGAVDGSSIFLGSRRVASAAGNECGAKARLGSTVF